MVIDQAKNCQKESCLDNIAKSRSANRLVKNPVYERSLNLLRYADRNDNTMKNPVYGQHLALSYMCDSKLPILYHESMSIP